MRFFLLCGLSACATYEPPERNFASFGQASDGDDGGETIEQDAIGGPEEDPDGDGYTNAEEVEAGTNPNYEYSHPYTGDYRVGTCPKRPNPTGPTKAQNYTSEEGSFDYDSYQQGDVAENFTLQDQYGELVDLYSFCGNHIMLVVGAGWCNPCRQEASQLQAVAEAYPEAQILQILAQDNNYNFPSAGFVQSWADQYGFENVAALAPRAAPTTYEEYFSSPSSQFEDDGYIPTIYHLDDRMRVVSADRGVQTPDTWL